MRGRKKWLWLGLLVIGVTLTVWWTLAREAGPGERTINLSIIAQTLYGAGEGVVRVKLGDSVTIQITADEAMEVFLHGYDVEAEVKPGTPSVMQFTADILGVYPLMIHSLGEDEGSHKRAEILLGFVEVLPRK